MATPARAAWRRWPRRGRWLGLGLANANPNPNPNPNPNLAEVASFFEHALGISEPFRYRGIPLTPTLALTLTLTLNPNPTPQPYP